MGRIKQQVDFDWAGADAAVQRAIALEPGDPDSCKNGGFLGQPCSAALTKLFN